MLKTEVYHGGDAMVGNVIKKVFANFNNGEDEIITCFDEHNEIKERFEKLWRILSNCFKYFSTKNLSENNLYSLVGELRKFTISFPLLFQE